MRTALATAAAILLSASAAVAAPASVSVVLGPELQTKAEKDYGVTDVGRIADELRRTVERRLAKAPAFDGATVELTLVDVKPNRPTFTQMGKTPGLSYQSFGIGGAKIEGRVVRADGTEQPVAYRWYENDIRWAEGHTTWHDAEWAFDRFAGRLARGEELAAR